MNIKVIVELLGMPGSGKTYYQKKILKFLGSNACSNDFTKFNKLKKIYFFILFFIEYPIFTIKSLIIFFNNFKNKKIDKKHFYYFHNEAAYRGYFNSRHSKKNYLINSEGFFYRTAYLFNNIIDKNLNNYLKFIPKVNILILVKTNKKKVFQRIKKRKKGYNYNKLDEKNYDKKEVFLKNLIKIKKLKKICNLVIDNNNSKYEKKNLSKIILKIKNNENFTY